MELRSAHDKADGYAMGINVFKGKVENMLENGVIEPFVVKQQAVKSAGESASMILRIDDVIAATKPAEPRGPPGGPESDEEEY